MRRQIVRPGAIGRLDLAAREPAENGAPHHRATVAQKIPARWHGLFVLAIGWLGHP
jgi:hypothetical protein